MPNRISRIDITPRPILGRQVLVEFSDETPQCNGNTWQGSKTFLGDHIKTLIDDLKIDESITITITRL